MSVAGQELWQDDRKIQLFYQMSWEHLAEVVLVIGPAVSKDTNCRQGVAVEDR